MKKKFIKTPLVGVQVHGAKDVGTRTVNLLMGEHAGEYVRGDIMDANAVIQAFDELKGNVDNNHDSLEEIVNEIHNFRDTTNHRFDVFQEKAEEETANRIQGDNTLDDKIDQKEIESNERDNVLQQNINTEKQERVNADTQLRNDLTAEVNRAKASENALSSDIQAEATKRENDDNTIKDNLNAEVTRATAKENEIKAEVDVINGDSTTEGSFRKAIADVVGAAPEAYDTLKEIADKLNSNDDLHTAINDAIATKATTVALNEEITRAKAAEAQNKAEIAAEAARAKEVEGDNALAIQNEASRATTAETAINESLNTEIDRAKGQEAYLQNLVNTKADTTAFDGAKAQLDKKISDETTRATGVEATKASADDLTAEVTRAKQAEAAITSDVTEKLAQKADTTALNNYVLTTALNDQVGTLNAAISAKQDAGSYIPYDASVTGKYQIDKMLAVKNAYGTALFGVDTCIDIKHSDTSSTVINDCSIQLKNLDNEFTVHPLKIIQVGKLGTADYIFSVDPDGINQVTHNYKFNVNNASGIRWSTLDDEIYSSINPYGLFSKMQSVSYANCNCNNFVDIKYGDSKVNINPTSISATNGNTRIAITPENLTINDGTSDDSNGLKLGYDGLHIGKKSYINRDNNQIISISVPFHGVTSSFEVSSVSGIILQTGDSEVVLGFNGVTLPHGDNNHVLTSWGTTIDISQYAKKTDLPKMQFVSSLPETTDSNTLYFVI